MIRGNPVDVLPTLFKEWKVTTLTFESDIEPYAKDRDFLVEHRAREHGVKVIQESSHTIYNPYLIVQKNAGKPVMQMQKFLAIVADLKVSEPILAPKKIPNNAQPPKDAIESRNSYCYELPTLEELGVDENDLGTILYPGGETEGLNRMYKYLKKTKWICEFEKPNTAPNSINPSTTVLSPYLKFGCLSSRLFFKELNQVLAKNKKHTKPPVSLVGQLMWREFYYAAAAGKPNFDRMVGNKICRQIPWDTNSHYLKAWKYGLTGYPFIDAIMRQLRLEGWIHHLARHAVACFLTRGDLWISWEEGQKVFEEYLLDADWALNAGNWMWLSASAFFYKYFRVYSPVAFGKKTDPDGKYIRKYVPELINYPKEYVYEPWKASVREQKQFKCVLGKDYPQRIVIHETIHKKNLSKMAAAYKNHHAQVANDDDDGDDDNPKKKIKKKKEESPEPEDQPTTSKRARATQSNTLLRYFKSEPASPNK